MVSNYPSNMIVLATHGGYDLPSEAYSNLSAPFKENDARLLRNFSDHATRFLIPYGLPLSQFVVCRFSRALGDPNRSLDDPELFRKSDFNGNGIWNTFPVACLREKYLVRYYKKYHSEVQQKIEAVEHETVVVFDLHDTGNVLMNKFPHKDSRRDPSFPPINVGNLEGKSCNNEVTSQFCGLLTEKLGLPVALNEPYKGGYVTKHYSQMQNVLVLQVEFGRYLYMDEHRQEVDMRKILPIRDGLAAAMAETARMLLRK